MLNRDQRDRDEIRCIFDTHSWMRIAPSIPVECVAAFPIRVASIYAGMLLGWKYQTDRGSIVYEYWN